MFALGAGLLGVTPPEWWACHVGKCIAAPEAARRCDTHIVCGLTAPSTRYTCGVRCSNGIMVCARLGSEQPAYLATTIPLFRNSELDAVFSRVVIAELVNAFSGMISTKTLAEVRQQRCGYEG